MKPTCWETEAGWRGQTDRKHQQKENLKVHPTAVTQRCCQHPGYNLNSGTFDCDIFCFFVAFVWARWGRVKWKHREGEKNNNTVSPVTHKRKHLSVRTLLFKNVYPRSLNDVRTSSSHAVRLLLKSRREQFSLPDSHELMDFHLPGGKTCFGSAFFCLHAHISVRVVIGELHSYKCTHYCVN